MNKVEDAFDPVVYARKSGFGIFANCATLAHLMLVQVSLWQPRRDLLKNFQCAMVQMSHALVPNSPCSLLESQLPLLVNVVIISKCIMYRLLCLTPICLATLEFKGFMKSLHYLKVTLYPLSSNAKTEMRFFLSPGM